MAKIPSPLQLANQADAGGGATSPGRNPAGYGGPSPRKPGGVTSAGRNPAGLPGYHTPGIGTTGIHTASPVYPPQDTGTSGANFGWGDWAKTAEHLLHQSGQAILGSGEAVGKAVIASVPNPRHPIAAVEGLVPNPIRDAQKIGHMIKGQWAADKYSWAPFISSLKHAGHAGLLFTTGNTAAAEREWDLYQRDRATFNRRFEQAPLLPVLDLMTLASFSGARLLALANLPADATAAQARAALIRGHNPGVRQITVQTHEEPGAFADTPEGYAGNTTPIRTLPSNAFRAGRMVVTDKILRGVTNIEVFGKGLGGPNAPIIGDYARAGRYNDAASARLRLTLLAIPEVQAFRKSFRKLDRWERAAAQWRVKLPQESDLNLYIASLRKDVADGKPGWQRKEQQANLLSNPNFRNEYLNPSEKTQDAIAKGRILMGKREEILRSTGHDLTELEDAKIRHIRYARGARYGPVLNDLLTLPDGTVVRPIEETADGTGYVVKVLTEDGELERQVMPIGDVAVGVAPKTVDELPWMWQHKIKFALQGGPDPEKIHTELANQGPGVEQPYYWPDVIDATTSKKGLGKPTGLTPAASDVRHWTGALMRAGALATRPDTLSASFLHSVVEAQATDLWRRTLSIAKPIAKGEELPRGMVWVRTVRGSHMPTGETHGAEHEGNVAKDFADIANIAGSHFTTNIHDAYEVKGFNYAVPEQYAKASLAMAKTQLGWASRFWRDSTNIWRRLVLNVRVGWLENNVVGNGVLTALHFAGWNGLRAFVDAVGEIKGPKAVREMMGLAKTWGMSREQIAKVFVEHTRPGTFVGANLPGSLAGQRAVWIQKGLHIAGAPIRALPYLDRITEEFFRQVGLNASLRNDPRVAAVYKSLPKQTRDWDQALAQADQESGARAGAIRDSVSRDVNDALGNFLSLTHKEQVSVRALVPFYAWYREITRIVTKFPFDHPGRANIVARLGLMQPIHDWPSYLQGDVATGGLDDQGRQELIKVRAMNPGSTVVDIASALWSFVGHPSTRGGQVLQGMFNPWAAEVAALITRASSGDNRAKAVLQGLYHDILLRLPEAQPFTNPSSKIYPGRTAGDQWLNFAGWPKVKIDPNEASIQRAVNK